MQIEDVFEGTVVSVCPDVVACRDINELSGNANAITCLADAALQHVANAKLAADPLDIDSLAFVGETCITGDDEQRFRTRQSRDDVFHHAVGEIFLLGVSAHVLKRQHGDRGLVGERKGRFRRFYRVVSGCRACGSLRFLHLSDETKALAAAS